MDIKDLSSRVEAILKHSTSIGKAWHFTSFVFRMVVTAVVGSSVYSDKSLICVTNLPGCSAMCYNTYAPISPWTFWLIQLCAVSLPMLCFQLITSSLEVRYHKVERKKTRDIELRVRPSNTGNTPSSGEGPSGDQQTDTEAATTGPITAPPLPVPEATPNTVETQTASEPAATGQRTAVANTGNPESSRYRDVMVAGRDDPISIFHDKGVKIAYLICSIVRTGIEIAFAVALHLLYSYDDPQCRSDPSNPYCRLSLPVKIPQQFVCKGPMAKAACRQQLMNEYSSVPCFVPRFWEQTIFHNYMALVTYLCALLSLLDCCFFSYKSVRDYYKSRSAEGDNETQ